MAFVESLTKVTIRHDEYYRIMKEAAKAELLSNAAKAEVPEFYVRAMVTGEKPEFLNSNELNAEEENIGFREEYERITGAVVSIFGTWTKEKGVKSAAISLHGLIDTLEENRIEELRMITENWEEHQEEMKERKSQNRDCRSCDTCKNSNPTSMDMTKCWECEDGSEYVKADTRDEKSCEMESGI